MSHPFYIPPVITHIREDGTKNVFTCQEKLGQGGFAVVYKVIHQNTNKVYAMKIISKQLITNAKGQSSLEKLKNEIRIQKKLVHPNIVQSKISFNDDFNYYIALEYCPGKTISEFLRTTGQGRLSEPEARKILRDVLNGLIYIHRRKIIHYDLKLENFMIGPDGKVKIADFGLSTFLKKEEDKLKNTLICGTPNYMSPEIILKKDSGNSFASDIWAIGVATYTMLTGKPPFAGYYKDAVYENIKNCQFSFPPNIPLSHEAKDFIKSIFKLDPKKRPSALELYKHPFMTKFDPTPIQLYQKVESPTKFENFDTDDQISSQLYTPRKNINMNTPIMHFPPLPPPPQTPLPQQQQPLIEIEGSHKKSILNGPQKVDLKQKKKNFVIPGNFVVKHTFLRDDLVYLLGNGTVGISFGDKSRIVMDPKEEFAQYYKDTFSPLKVIDLLRSPDVSSSSLDEKISLVKNFARAFKKFHNLYEQPRNNNNIVSSIPLHHVSSFIKRENAVLCKFSNKNIQAIFDDGKKFIIFWSSKKMCITKNLKEKCILLGQNDISKMSAEDDELVKYKKTKEMLNALVRNR